MTLDDLADRVVNLEHRAAVNERYNHHRSTELTVRVVALERVAAGLDDSVVASNRDYQPGDGSRYDLMLVDEVDRYVVVALGLGAMALSAPKDNPVLAIDYVAEKMYLERSDAIAIIGWLVSLDFGWRRV